ITTINNQTASITNGSLAGRLDQYQKGWNKIKAAVDTASSTLNTIISTCSQQTGSAQAGAAIMSAQTALSSVVAPAYSEVLAADAVIAQAQSLMNSAATDSTTRPTFDDMTYAVQQSAATGNARANPDGSLNVYGGTMLDRMNLVSANAAQLQAACYPNANVPSGG
ncbi:MAG TPA: hypothetical protein VFP46_02505, partial [Candidatus Paceibacterota bacterium]|nr:hypothetical protein [Candidatus Paceibacterota bacterium]